MTETAQNDLIDFEMLATENHNKMSNGNGHAPVANGGSGAISSSGPQEGLGKRIMKHVVELVYWRDPKKSGIAFGTTFIVLLCLASFSLISVVAYLGLILLGLTISFRVYKSAMATLHKGDKENPFKLYLEKDLTLPQDRVHAQVDVCLAHAQDAAHQLRRLILVEDFLDTAKFAFLLWALTYVGAWFSGMTLLILALIAIFTIPKFYEMYQPQIDEYWGMAAGHIKTVTDQVEANVPFLKKKEA